MGLRDEEAFGVQDDVDKLRAQVADMDASIADLCVQIGDIVQGMDGDRDRFGDAIDLLQVSVAAHTKKIRSLERAAADVEPEKPRRQLRTAYPETTWRAIAESLWGLLDDIDTISDVAKGNDRAYRTMVEKVHPKRMMYMVSHDGQTLTLPDCVKIFKKG